MYMKNIYKDIFGEDLKQEQYKMQDHVFVFSKRLGKSYCSKCGLVSLRNQFTNWSVAKGCFSEYHPDYQRMRKCTGL